MAGHDNQMLANEMVPPLSSIELPYDEMGKLAVETLMQLAQGRDRLPCDESWRGSSLSGHPASGWCMSRERAWRLSGIGTTAWD